MPATDAQFAEARLLRFEGGYVLPARVAVAVGVLVELESVSVVAQKPRLSQQFGQPYSEKQVRGAVQLQRD